MKTKTFMSIALYLLCFSIFGNTKTYASSNFNPEDSIRIMSTPDLYDLTSNWIKEYCSVNSNMKIKVSKLSDQLINKNLSSESNLYFVSNEFYTDLKSESIWKMVIGTDALVPIINSNNPYLNEINLQGISPEKLTQLLNTPGNQNWETLLGKGQKMHVNYYIIKGETIKSDIANFLKLNQDNIKGINVESGDEMISSIQKDPYAIGFCKISSILNKNKQGLVNGINLLPIDKNGNGKIDYNEKIYDNLNSFLRGVWIGKYPKELSRSIYSIASIKPNNDNEVAFLAWVLTNGQQFLNSNGYVDLASNQRKANIEKLYSKDVNVKTSSHSYTILIAVLVLTVFIALFFILDIVVQRIRQRKAITVDANSTSLPFFDERSIVVPEGLYFDKSHTWAFMEKNGAVSIGIDDFLQHVTGPITRIKMKESGEKVRKGDHFLTIIQDGKQLNIKSPLSGTIKSQNKNLASNSSLINQSPYSEGWVYLIEPTNWLRDTQFLIFANGYKEWLRMEFLHLKDFLAVALRANLTEVVLQDGGEIKNGILKDLKPEIWEDFQNHFLDSSM